MYVILFGGASFSINQAAYPRTLREAARMLGWYRSQYTTVIFRNYVG